MILYFDTSALVATYVADACTEDALFVRGQASVIATSLLTYAETLAAFAILQRSRRLTVAQRRRVESRFQADWMAFQCVRVDKRLLPDVRRILAEHPLKGADAVHLATASRVARACAAAGVEHRFACDDRALAAAAKTEGLALAW